MLACHLVVGGGAIGEAAGTTAIFLRGLDLCTFSAILQWPAKQPVGWLPVDQREQARPAESQCHDPMFCSGIDFPW